MADQDKWIRLAQTGDHDAFTLLISHYQQQIYGLSYRFFNNHHDAEDATQDTIIKIYRSIGGYRGDSSFKSWVATIAANTCRDILRKRKNRDAISYDDEDVGDYLQPVNECREENPETSYVDKEGMERLREAIACLPENFRMVIVMREFGQMNYEEISVALGTSLGTVKSRINRGRKLLREMVTESREQDGDK